MSVALIGYTGFVGSSLLRQTHFDVIYNSRNIESIQDTNHDLIFCAAAPGTKWYANANPDEDLISIARLIDNLKTARAHHFILFSTIDIYPRTQNVDEDFTPLPKDISPYGAHRRMLELFVEAKFSSTIVRLPGLFGLGLKKNVIYDLINNRLQYVESEDVFQYYNIARLYKDLLITLNRGISLINFVTEPLSVRCIACEAFGIILPNAIHKGNVQYYDVRTKHAQHWNKNGLYLYTRDEVLQDLKDFLKG